MLETLTHNALMQQFETPFQVEHQSAPSTTIDLVEVGTLHESPEYESFSITFRGPLDAFLPQAIHRFQHDVLGVFDLFIVPIRQDGRGFYYEACFNRMRTGGPT